MVAVVLGSVAVLIGAAAALIYLGDSAKSTIAGSAPTYEPTTADPFPTVDSSASPGPTSTTSSSPSPSWSPRASSTPASRVTPRKPQGPSDIEVLQKNKLYKAGAQASVRCRESGSRPSTKEGVRRYYGNLVGCLNRAWPKQIKQAGVQFRAPTVLIWSGSFESPCGGNALSFYCGRNETIYMRWDQDVNQYNKFSEHYQKVYARMGATHTVAHEYGHHVQQLTGILGSSWDLRYAASTESAKLAMSRRVELQASCLANVFLGANQPSYPITGESRRQWIWLVEHLGDEYATNGVRDHGSRHNHGFWAKKGFRSESPSSCNTFTTSSNVS